MSDRIRLLYSIVVPALNEEKTIGEVLHGLERLTADLIVVVARSEGSSGEAGISLFTTPGDAPGLERRFYHRTANATYYWDGLSYILQAGSTVRQGLEANLAGVVAGDVYESTDGPFSEIFDGSSFNQKGPAFPLIKPTAFSTWTNRGTVEGSKSEIGGGLYLRAAAAAGQNAVLYNKTAPATPYTITMAVLPFNWGNATARCGIQLFETSTGKFTSWHWDRVTAVAMANWTNNTTFLALLTFDNMMQFGPVTWFRIEDDGVNISVHLSFDGINFDLRGSVGRTSHMAGGPDEYGFFTDAGSAGNDSQITVLSVEEA